MSRNLRRLREQAGPTQEFDASILSDAATAPGRSSFPGAFVGVACQDVAGTAKHADFDFFAYEERDYRTNPRA